MKSLLLSLLCCLPSPKPIPSLPDIRPTPILVPACRVLKIDYHRYQITDDTKVFWDGAPAELKNLPDSAELFDVEIASDGYSVSVLRFKSKP